MIAAMGTLLIIYYIFMHKNSLIAVCKYIKCMCCFSAKHTSFNKERAKTGWLEIRIMCSSGEACLSADCCFSELTL